MAQVIRRPPPHLAPFVEVLWASDAPVAPVGRSREHLLPSGLMHIVFRLGDSPLRIFGAEHDNIGQVIGPAVVGGSRASFYVRELGEPCGSVGAQLKPGSAAMLFGASAFELAGRHTPLDELWGSATASARERMLELVSPHHRLALLESLLSERLPRVRGVHPAIAQALMQLDGATPVHRIVEQSGYSHRTFLNLFRETVGLAPKAFSRVLRFGKILKRIQGDPDVHWVDLALAAGYSDQAHFSREFRQFSGVTPEEYRRTAPGSAHHVPVTQAG